MAPIYEWEYFFQIFWPTKQQSGQDVCEWYSTYLFYFLMHWFTRKFKWDHSFLFASVLLITGNLSSLGKLSRFCQNNLNLLNLFSLKTDKIMPTLAEKKMFLEQPESENSPLINLAVFPSSFLWIWNICQTRALQLQTLNESIKASSSLAFFIQTTGKGPDIFTIQRNFCLADKTLF